MLVTKAIVFPSGDQAVPPTTRVMYSFSISKLRSTCASGLLVICLGSVMAGGTGRDVVWDCDWASVTVLIRMTIAKRNAMRIGVGGNGVLKNNFLMNRKSLTDGGRLLFSPYLKPYREGREETSAKVAEKQGCGWVTRPRSFSRQVYELVILVWCFSTTVIVPRRPSSRPSRMFLRVLRGKDFCVSSPLPMFEDASSAGPRAAKAVMLSSFEFRVGGSLVILAP